MLRSMKVCVEGKSSLTDKWKVCEQTMNQSEKILEIKDLCVEFQTVEGTVKAINHLNIHYIKVRSLVLSARAEAVRVSLHLALCS